MNQMEESYEYLKTLCSSRKSIREFTNAPVDEEVIGKIKTIAYTSPYASGKKNWEIIVIKEKNKIEELANLVKIQSSQISNDIRDDFKDSFLEYSEKFIFFKNAPALLIPTFRTSLSMSYMIETDFVRQWERDNYVKSISCVGMLILLAAESLGLGSCYMTGPLLFEEELIKHIPIKPQHRIGAIIPIGYYKE